jgi:hypothetical protein
LHVGLVFVDFAVRIMATLMGNRAVDPKVLARKIHAWDSAFGRHRKAGHPVLVRDVEAALKLLRRAEKALRKCVYEKKSTLVREEVARFDCVGCTKPLDLAEFNETIVHRRVAEPMCRVCTKLRARAAAQDEERPATPAPPASPQEEQDTQEAPDPTDGVS